MYLWIYSNLWNSKCQNDIATMLQKPMSNRLIVLADTLGPDGCSYIPSQHVCLVDHVRLNSDLESRRLHRQRNTSPTICSQSHKLISHNYRIYQNVSQFHDDFQATSSSIAMSCNVLQCHVFMSCIPRTHLHPGPKVLHVVIVFLFEADKENFLNPDAEPPAEHAIVCICFDKNCGKKKYKR